MQCRVYDTLCVNDRFCRARDACCAGDMECVPLSIDEMSIALDEACRIALEWIELGIPDDDANIAKFRIQSLLATGTGRSCTCTEMDGSKCAVHP
jgi:hypothetical protein